MRPDIAVLPPRFLRTKEAADFLSLSARTLDAPHLWHWPWLPKARRPCRLCRRRPSGLGRTRRSHLYIRPAWIGPAGQASHTDAAGARRTIRTLTARGSQMVSRNQSLSERGQLDLFRALPGDFAPRDAQDLMAYPFFSLSKTHRTTPIDFAAGNVTIRVEAVPDHGMATIWDADILIWAASQIVEARDTGLRTSRLSVGAGQPEEKGES